jgi:hypothetical protein
MLKNSDIKFMVYIMKFYVRIQVFVKKTTFYMACTKKV